MVKKKYTSKRQSLKDKYKIQRRVVESNRKARKKAKKDSKLGIRPHKKKDPGIPNSWPFKRELLEEIAVAKERALEQKKQKKTSVEELVKDAAQKRVEYDAKQQFQREGTATEESLSSTELLLRGQSSRRAYFKELKKVIDGSDVLLQILDARDPAGTRCSKSIEETILSRPDKKLVLVLNKVDLVPKDAVKGWLVHLRKRLPCIAVKAGSSGSSSHSSIGRAKGDDALRTSAAIGMEGLLHLLKNYARNGDTKTCITVGIIGYPNVGKSSIINSLKRCRAVGVSPRPGFTTSSQEVVLDKNIRLYDSPGVVFDDRDDDDVLLRNCVNVDTLSDPISPISSLLSRCSPSDLMMTYALPKFNSTDMFLAMIAKRYGKVLKGGIPDKLSAAKCVLRDWNEGKIPYFVSPPEEEEETSNVIEDAEIVKQFDEMFDVEKKDEEVLKSLKEDEIDFVKLDPVERREEGQEMELEEMEEEDEEQKGNLIENSKMKDAEDYDFDEL